MSENNIKRGRGRPKKAEKKINMSFRLAPSLADWLRAEKARGRKMGPIVEMAIFNTMLSQVGGDIPCKDLKLAKNIKNLV